MFKQLCIILVACFFAPVFGNTIHVSVNVPALWLNPHAQEDKAQFEQQLQETVLSINKKYNTPILGFSPMGGSKITAFKELSLDGFVIVDCDRPGSPATIAKTFEDTAFRELLYKALDQALNGGAMNSYIVMSVSVNAQLLARLWYELNVSSVRVQFYLPKNINLPVPNPNLPLWDGPTVEASDAPLVTRMLFQYQNQPKELVFITSKVTSDAVSWRHSLPIQLMHSLAPEKFHWGYLSADGVGFFSHNHQNGLQKGSEEFLALLTTGAGIILEYPHASWYTDCSQSSDGVNYMCGRENLENWGLVLAKSIHTNVWWSLVFGYTGFTQEDEVRIYQKPDQTIPAVTENKTIFSFDDFVQIGDEYEFELKASKIVAR